MSHFWRDERVNKTHHPKQAKRILGDLIPFLLTGLFFFYHCWIYNILISTIIMWPFVNIWKMFKSPHLILHSKYTPTFFILFFRLAHITCMVDLTAGKFYYTFFPILDTHRNNWLLQSTMHEKKKKKIKSWHLLVTTHTLILLHMSPYVWIEGVVK